MQRTFFSGSHLRTEEFNQKFYEETIQEINTICESEERSKNIHNLDYEITTEDAESAIYLLEIGNWPGADGYFPELFQA